MENEERSENVRLGQARAKAQGKEIGRPREIVSEVEARIAALGREGQGYKVIARAVGVSRSTVRRLLKCRAHAKQGAESIPQSELPTPALSVAVTTIA